MTKTCKNCGIEFERSGRKEYCTVSCRRKYRQSLHPKAPKRCNAPGCITRVNGKGRRYCSTACIPSAKVRAARRRLLATRPQCAYIDCENTATSHRNTFCSPECRSLDQAHRNGDHTNNRIADKIRLTMWQISPAGLDRYLHKAFIVYTPKVIYACAIAYIYNALGKISSGKSMLVVGDLIDNNTMGKFLYKLRLDKF